MVTLMRYLSALLNSFRLILWRNRVRQSCLYISFVWGGGASSYLENEISCNEGWAIIVKPVGGWHRVGVEIYKEGNLQISYVVLGLAPIWLLRGRVSKIVINQIILWHVYERKVYMTNDLLDKIVSKLLSLRKFLNAKLVYLVHDYYSLCPRWTITSSNGIYCNSEYSCVRCKECLGAGSDAYFYDVNMDIHKWRASFKRLIDETDEVRVFSKDTLNRTARIYPDARLICKPHRVISHLRKPNLAKCGVTVGVIGMRSLIKGSRQVDALGEYIMKKNLDWKIVVVDHYKREELPSVIEQKRINVAFFSSVWPETFSYVTQEIMDMDLPIVCFNLGAPAERVRGYVKGCVAKDFNPESVVGAINCLIKKGVINA